MDALLEDGPVDLLCFTGDAADWGRPEELERAGELLGATLEHLELGWERFFTVPGNHDIQRKTSAAQWKALRRRVLAKAFDPNGRLALARWMAGAEMGEGLGAEERRRVLARQRNYRRWLKSLGRDVLLPGAGRVEGPEIPRVERAGSRYSMMAGPFHVWLSFLDRALRSELEDEQRSKVLWTLTNVARSAGALRRALQAAGEKRELDRGLGEERGEAFALSAQADVLTAWGDLAEALRIRRQEEVPVYERLGDVRELAVARGRIADILFQQGDLVEALRICREEELPVYERLADLRSLLMVKAKIALTLRRLPKHDPAEVAELLCWSLAAAERMGIPEAEEIRGFCQAFGIECPPE